MKYGIQPGDRVVWVRSPGRSFLSGWRVMAIPGIVVKVCRRRIKTKIQVDFQEKTVIVDPDNVIIGGLEEELPGVRSCQMP